MDDTPGRVNKDPIDVAGRATERTRGYAGDRGDADDRDDVGGRTAEIRQEIEETRGEIVETVDAIQEKLKPRNIVANATERVKSAATERVREMADTASQTAQQAMDYTRGKTTGVSETMRENPIPLALIGIGAAWLLSNRSRGAASSRPRSSGRDYGRDYGEYGRAVTRDESLYDDERTGSFMARIRHNPIPAALAGVGLSWLAFSSGERVERDSGRWRGPSGEGAWRTDRSDDSAVGDRSVTVNLTESASQMASRGRQYASETTASMRRMTQRRQNQLQRMVQENPLLVGAGALMLGAAFGLAVPETETENEWMGDARDNMVDRAREMAHDAASQVQEAASNVADTANKFTKTDV
jgi:hypothetical protein